MQTVLPIEECQCRELDKLVTDRDWLDEQASRLAGWEILVRACNGQLNQPLEVSELYDKIGNHRLRWIIADLQKKVKDEGQ